MKCITGNIILLEFKGRIRSKIPKNISTKFFTLNFSLTPLYIHVSKVVDMFVNNLCLI